MIYEKLGQLCRDKTGRAYRVGMPIQVKPTAKSEYRGLFGTVSSIHTGDEPEDDLTLLVLHCRLNTPFDRTKVLRQVDRFYSSGKEAEKVMAKPYLDAVLTSDMVLDSVALLGITQRFKPSDLWVQYLDANLLKLYTNGRRTLTYAESEDQMSDVPTDATKLGQIASKLVFVQGEPSTINLHLYEQLRDKWFELQHKQAG